MLTDDELTTQLGAAYRSATQDLTYAGRRRPRRTAQAVLPLAAASVAMGAIGIAALAGPDPAPPVANHGPAPAIASPSSSTSTAPRMVTEHLKLAGFTLSFQRQVGSQPPVYAVLGVRRVPDGFRKVTLSGTSAKAWIGKEPSSGESALYVLAPTRNGGRLFALRSSQWSPEKLVALFKGTPMPVPAVEE